MEDIDPLALPTGYETKYEPGTGCRDGYMKSELMDDLARDSPEEDVKPFLHIELHASDIDSSPMEDIDPLALPTYEHGTYCRDGYIKSELMDDLASDFPEEDVKPFLHIEIHASDIITGECESFQQDPLGLAPGFKVESDVLRNINLTETGSTGEKLQLPIKQEVSEILSESRITSSVGNMEESCANSSALAFNNDQSKPYFAIDKCGQAVQNNLCYGEKVISTHRTCKKDTAVHHSGIPQEEQCHKLISSARYSNGDGSHPQQWEKTLSNKLGGQSNNGMLSPTINRIKKNLIECAKLKMVGDSLAPKAKSDVCTNSLNNVSTQSPTLTRERPYCDLCKKLFCNKYYLRLHEQIHTGAKPYQCEVCEKSFNRKGHLHVHRRLHTGEKPHRCEFCTKTFTDRANMVRHVRMHIGERPYNCNICGQSFYQKSNLSEHLLKHSGERPFQCNVCKKTFYRESNMRTHIRRHANERQHHCEICKKSFRFNYDLTVHVATHTSQRRHKIRAMCVKIPLPEYPHL